MNEPPADPLGVDLDRLYNRFIAALERGPGMRGGAAPEPPKPAPGDPAPEPEPQPETLHYSRGRDKYDAYPEQRTVSNFEAFAEAVLSDRSRAKGLTWISGPFARNDDGRHHRCGDGLQSRRFLANDLDGATPEAFVDLGMWLGAYSGFGYTTASHTTENPHARFILELSRPVSRAEGIRLGEAMQQQIEARLGPGAVKLDPSVYRGEQPIYGPLFGAETMRYYGDPVDVDQILKDAPPLEERPGRAERAAAIASRDPVVRALTDRRMIKRDHGEGRLFTVCPREDEHTVPGSESSTVYFLPNFGGVPYGKFVCLHQHCKGRQQEDFLRALNLDPREVWREQRGGSAPYDALPPIESYAADAAEAARQHTAGAKALGGDEARSGNGAATGEFCGGEVVHRCLFDIEEKPYHWLWEGRIAKGKVTMLAGHPDLGKSQVTASMAAVVTTGGTWPVDGTQCKKGKVIILSAEDLPEDTIRPRFRAAGADLKQVEILDAVREPNRDGTLVERFFNLTVDIERLGWLAREIGGAALIVIDPITAYLGGIDSHKNAEVRAVLAPLAAMAAEIDAAVVCISHMTKVGGTEAMLRVMGSLGFVAAARAAYLVAKDPEDETRRLFLPMKNNLAKDRGGLAFWVKGKTLDGGIETSCVEWDAEPVTMTADEAMTAAGDPEERSELDEAADWLGKLLANGPVDSKEIPTAAKQSGIAWRTVERAKTRLRVKSRKRDYAAGWWWSLPEHTPPEHATVGGLEKPAPLKPSCGAGSTEDRQAPNGHPPSTPLKPSCGAGSTEDRQASEDLGGLGSNPGGTRVPGVSSPHGAEGVGGLGSNPGGTRVVGDRNAEDRQCVGDGGQVEGDGPDQEPAAGKAEERETPWETRL